MQKDWAIKIKQIKIVGSMPYERQGYLINNKGDTIFYLEAAQHIGVGQIAKN